MSNNKKSAHDSQIKNKYEKYIETMQIKSHSAASAFALLVLVLLATSASAMPVAPDWLIKLFDNTIFKIAYLAIILIMFNYCPLTALIIAIIFLVILQSINKYIASNNKKDDVKSTAQTIIQAVADTSSELVTDTGAIIKGIGRNISKVHNYVITEDSFNNLQPIALNNNLEEMTQGSMYTPIPDLYIGSPRSQDFSDTVSEKNKYFDSITPQPESQYVDQPIPDQSVKNEDFTSFSKVLEKNYVPISDLYQGPPHPQNFSDTRALKNKYFDNETPKPMSQYKDQPKNKLPEGFITTPTINYSAIPDLYNSVPFIQQYPKYEGNYSGILTEKAPQPLNQTSVYPESL